MARAGERIGFNTSGTSGFDFAGHFTGNEMVRFAVNQQNGNFGMADGILGIAGIEFELTEDQCAQMDKGAAKRYGIVHIFTYLLNNCAGSRVRGISHNAGDVCGQIKLRGHQHCGSAHGEAGQQDGGIAAKAGSCILGPAFAVLPFLDAEGDDPAFALAVGALVHYQSVESHLPGQGMSTAAVPEGATAVTVKEDLQRSAVFQVIVAAVELCAVKGLNCDRLEGEFFHDLRSKVDVFGYLVVLAALQRVIWLGMLFGRGIKCGAENIVRD